jgi:hypothetical protein
MFIFKRSFRSVAAGLCTALLLVVIERGCNSAGASTPYQNELGEACDSCSRGTALARCA